MKNITTICFE